MRGTLPLTLGDTSAAPAELLLIEHRRRVCYVTLNRPLKLNALSGELIERLSLSLLSIERSDDVCDEVVLQGAGKAFCAGGDVAALATLAETATAESIAQGNHFMARQYQLNHLCATLKRPVVAVWDGIAMGGGLGISIGGDFRICTERTMIAMPECSIAFFPDVGASYFLNRLRPGVGLWLALSGARLKGADALRYGLATHYVKRDRLASVFEKLEGARGSLEAIDRVLSAHSEAISDSDSQQQLREIEAIFTAPSLAEVLQRLEASPAAWAKSTLDNIRSGSPTAVSVTFALLARTRDLPAEACRTLELRVHNNFMRLADFVEGTFAKLVSKPPRRPTWSPARIEDCSQEYIESFFVSDDAPLILRDAVADPERQNRYARYAKR